MLAGLVTEFEALGALISGTCGGLRSADDFALRKEDVTTSRGGSHEALGLSGDSCALSLAEAAGARAETQLRATRQRWAAHDIGFRPKARRDGGASANGGDGDAKHCLVRWPRCTCQMSGSAAATLALPCPATAQGLRLISCC